MSHSPTPKDLYTWRTNVAHPYAHKIWKQDRLSNECVIDSMLYKLHEEQQHEKRENQMKHLQCYNELKQQTQLLMNSRKDYLIIKPKIKQLESTIHEHKQRIQQLEHTIILLSKRQHFQSDKYWIYALCFCCLILTILYIIIS